VVKVIYLIRRKPGMSAEDFHRYWREVHGSIAARIPGLRRYVQCHAIDGGPGFTGDFDGAAEVWFDDVEALRRAAASAEYAAAREDEGRFIDLDRSSLLLTEEIAVIG
jgi:uncharacterized protein (TIGR02118 family)